MHNFIQVFEYQKLKYSNNEYFTQDHFNTMVRFNERNKNKYFTVIHKGVQFSNYVGVLQIGKLTIEILPKADNTTISDTHLWQSVLLDMLKVCKQIKIDNVSETKLRRKYNSILDVYFEMYINEIEVLVRNGLIKNYKRNKSNQLALKGKVLFSQNIQKNLIHKERFYCENQVYNKDHLIHQILFKALLILDNLLDDTFKNKLKKILFYFEGFKELNITDGHFKKVRIDRKNQSYQKALEIAKMIILNYSPSLNSGRDNMLTLLFDMNMLWEEYIYRILQKYKPKNTKVTFQNKKHFWKSNFRTKLIKPDIVINQTIDKTNITYIIDTKWKIRQNNNPDDNDLKQMFTYNLYWRAEKSLLLFPKINQEDSDFGKYYYLGSQMETNQCKLGFVSIIDGNKIKSAEILCSEIFNKLV